MGIVEEPCRSSGNSEEQSDIVDHSEPSFSIHIKFSMSCNVEHGTHVSSMIVPYVEDALSSGDSCSKESPMFS